MGWGGSGWCGGRGRARWLLGRSGWLGGGQGAVGVRRRPYCLHRRHNIGDYSDFTVIHYSWYQLRARYSAIWWDSVIIFSGFLDGPLIFWK